MLGAVMYFTLLLRSFSVRISLALLLEKRRNRCKTWKTTETLNKKPNSGSGHLADRMYRIVFYVLFSLLIYVTFSDFLIRWLA